MFVGCGAALAGVAFGPIIMQAFETKPLEQSEVLSRSSLPQSALVVPHESPELSISTVPTLTYAENVSPVKPMLDPIELPSSIEIPSSIDLPELTYDDQSEHSVLLDGIADQEPHRDNENFVQRLPAQRTPSRAVATRYQSTNDGPVDLPRLETQNSTALARSVRIQNARFDGTPRDSRSVEQASFESTPTRASRPSPPAQALVGPSLQQPMMMRMQVSPQIERRAAEHLQYGESLYRRQSFFASREEFTLALLLIASSHDSSPNPQAYANRLAQGLTALDEAGDFAVLKRSGLRGPLEQKISAHKTRLITPQQIASITPTKALDLYYGFAQSQIEQAIGYSAGGSQALHALGKLELKATDADSRIDWTGQSRALVFFRAAMSVDPTNSVCSNDLGVLLYDLGRLQEAEEAFKLSLGSSQSLSGWENLAMVHRQMASSASGEERNRQIWLANLATKESNKFAYQRVNSSLAGDQWATSAEFENNAAFPNPVVQQNAGSQTANSQIRGVAPKAASLLNTVKGWH